MLQLLGTLRKGHCYGSEATSRTPKYHKANMAPTQPTVSAARIVASRSTSFMATPSFVLLLDFHQKYSFELTSDLLTIVNYSLVSYAQGCSSST